MSIYFKPSFIRQFKLLENDLQEEILYKIEQLKDQKNHQILKVHKLKGRLKNRYSFSVNYKIRIVFNYISSDQAVLLAIGNHQVYNQ